jgi:hypothetical protein
MRAITLRETFLFDGHPMLMPKASNLYDSVAPTRMCPAASDSANSTPPAAGHTEPIRVMFLVRKLPDAESGRAAEQLITRLNPNRFIPSLSSLHELGTVGETLARTIPATSHVVQHRLDLAAVVRLARQLRGRIDALLTVGSGEPMFWGCAAARWARTPVVLSVLDPLDRPVKLPLANRVVVHWSDGLITDRDEQRRDLIQRQRLVVPAIHVIPPGVDTQQFNFQPTEAFSVRRRLQVPSGAPLCGLAAVNWTESSLRRTFEIVNRVRSNVASAQFVLISSDASSLSVPQRLQQARLDMCVHVVDGHDDLPRVLSALNVLGFVGPSLPQPILAWQAMSTQVPVVAGRESGLVDSPDLDGANYWLAAGDANELAGRMAQLIGDPLLARRLGERMRQFVRKYRSLEVMVRRYEQLIIDTHQRKRSGPGAVLPAALHDTVEFCGAAP